MGDNQIMRRVNSDGSTTITVKGSLSIESSSELRQVLAEALDEAPQVNLNVTELENIDLTSLQVICSGCKSASSMGRGFDCESVQMPECISATGKRLGAPQGLPCAQNDNKPCIWYGGVQ